MAQFRPPGENPWHQFLTQGMPQITRLVEGAREEKRIETQQAREDTLSIVNTLINVSGKYTAAGDYKASSNALKNASNIVSKSPHLKDLNLEFLIKTSDESNEYLITRDQQDTDIINNFLEGNVTGLEARNNPLLSTDGISTLDGLIKTDAVSGYRFQGLEQRLNVINTLLNAMKKTEVRDRLPKEIESIVKTLGVELGKISKMAIRGGTENLPTTLGEMNLSPGFWESSPEEQANELAKMAEQASVNAEEKLEIEEPAAAQVGGLKANPIEGDDRNVQIEYGGKTGTISKTNWDIATGIKRALTRQGPIRAIAKALQMSPKEVERILESAQPKTEVTKPSSSPAVNKSFLKYYPPPDSLNR